MLNPHICWLWEWWSELKLLGVQDISYLGQTSWYWISVHPYTHTMQLSQGSRFSRVVKRGQNKTIKRLMVVEGRQIIGLICNKYMECNQPDHTWTKKHCTQDGLATQSHMDMNLLVENNNYIIWSSKPRGFEARRACFSKFQRQHWNWDTIDRKLCLLKPS